MQTENTSPALDELEEEFEEISRNMSVKEVSAVQKGLSLGEKDNTTKVMKARIVWQKLQTCKAYC